jgi:hypothetical protein
MTKQKDNKSPAANKQLGEIAAEVITHAVAQRFTVRVNPS